MTTIEIIACALMWYEAKPDTRSISLDTKTYTIDSLCLPGTKLSIWLHDSELGGGMHYTGGAIDLVDRVRADKAEQLAKLQAELAQ